MGLKYNWCKLLLFSLLFLQGIAPWAFLQAQSVAKIYGRVCDTLGHPLEMVNVTVNTNPPLGTVTNEMGRYELQIPANKNLEICFSMTSYQSEFAHVYVKPGYRIHFSVNLKPIEIVLPEFEMTENANSEDIVQRIDTKAITSIPSMNNGVESMVKISGLGVHSSNELSAQYNVRGGSYDENLIYVNGTEIFRPFLIRSGQQEGLSFINSDLVSAVRFSSGGFDALYGDKMASVLDVDYRKPEAFEGSLSASFLGASAHLGGCSQNEKFSYLLGARYKSNAYILKQMQTKGNYQPNFTDFQAILRYHPFEKWNFTLFGNFARNEYKLIPESSEATIGNILSVLQKLMVYYDGQEVDAYKTVFSSFTADYDLSQFSRISLVSSFFRSSEKETFDINAEYWLSDINMNFGSEEFGETISSRAVGGELHHGRNFLTANLFQEELKGRHVLGIHLLKWGLSYRMEDIDDQLKEWYMYDSSYYSLPHPYTPPGDSVAFDDSSRLFLSSDYLNVNNWIRNHRFSVYLQDQLEFGLKRFRYILTAGVRGSYATFNSDFYVTPRLRMKIEPMGNKNLSFYAATGLFYQPTFYKEMRNTHGELNSETKSQKSFHFIVGADYFFSWGNKPFKLTGEAYYKYLWDLISYQVDNVRIIYSGSNDAIGYAVGGDLKLSGELLPGLESWFSVSLLKTMEDLTGDSYIRYLDSAGNVLTSEEGADHSETVYPGWIPRPTDQRFSLNLFFQDQIPKFPSLKVHINMVYATPLPFGIVGTPQYTHTYRSKAYFRTDVGFSWKFYTRTSGKNGFWSHLKSGILTAEILNMFNYYNVISYTAITDIDGSKYLTPNYLTPRLYNLKIRFEL